MATINKKVVGTPEKRKPRPTEQQGIINKIYNSKHWRNLRKAYLMEHPLCEECLSKGLTKAAEDVHHIKPILTGQNELEYWGLALNPWNLMSLCKDCHHKIHDQLRGHTTRKLTNKSE